MIGSDPGTTRRLDPPRGPKRPFWSGNAADFAGDSLAFYRECERVSDDGVVRLHLWRHPIYVVDPSRSHRRRPREEARLLHEVGAHAVLGTGIRGRSAHVGGGLIGESNERPFSPSFIRRGSLPTARSSRRRRVRLAEAFRHGEVRNAYADVRTLCLDSMSRSIFGEDGASAGELVTNLAEALQGFHVEGTRWLERPAGGLLFTAFRALSTRAGRPDWNFDWSDAPLGFARPFRRAVQRLDEYVYRNIADARRGRRGTGLLPCLIDAQAEDNAPLTDEQIRDEVVTMFLAGHETTASSIVFALDLLAAHPSALTRVQREADDLLGGAEPTMETLRQLPYLRSVITETLRLFPPAYRVSRTVVKDCTLGPYDIEAGAELIIPQWAVHRSKRHFEEPDAFVPERWTPELMRGLHRFAYLPFGSGPRTCIGNNLALLEAGLVLSMLTHAWSFRRPPGAQVETYDGFSLVPRGGRLDLMVETRGASA